MSDQLNFDRGEIKDTLDHFGGAKTVSHEALQEYGTRKGHKRIITPGEYEDWLFQYESDKRMETFVPAIMSAIAKYRNVPELGTDADRQAIADANEAIIYEVCAAIEEHGILYQEVQLIKSISERVNALLMSAELRVNNMAARLFQVLAEDKFGRPLVVKTLGTEFRSKGLDASKTTAEAEAEEKAGEEVSPETEETPALDPAHPVE